MLSTHLSIALGSMSFITAKRHSVVMLGDLMVMYILQAMISNISQVMRSV